MFDEGKSALDILTEKAVFKRLETEAGKTTIIVVPPS